MEKEFYSPLQVVREAEREKARASLADKQRLDIEYLKNTVLKLYETGMLAIRKLSYFPNCWYILLSQYTDEQVMLTSHNFDIIFHLTGQAPVLLPAFAMLLHFSPTETKRCQEGLARQAEAAPEEAVNQSTAPAGSEAEGGSYLGGWASWAFGEAENADR